MKKIIEILKEEGYLLNEKEKEQIEEIAPGYGKEDLVKGNEYYLVGGRLYEADNEYILSSYKELVEGGVIVEG